LKLKDSTKFLILFIVLVGIVATTIAVQLGFNPFAKADPALVPEQILVTNQGSNSTTISFMTFATKANSVIKYGKQADAMDSISYDANNINNSAAYESNIHYHKLSGLTPDTTYYYKVTVGGQEELNNGVPFQFFTSKDAGTPETPSSIYGKVIGGSECIVNVHAINGSKFSAPLSTWLAANGTYTIDANLLVDRQDLSKFPQNSNTQLIVFVTCADNKRGAVLTELVNKIADITVTSSYAISQYSIGLTDVTGSSITPTVSGTESAVTPTAKVTGTIKATVTPRASVTPTTETNQTPVPTITSDPTVTPTNFLPKSGIKEDLPIYGGLLLIIVGFVLNQYLKKSSSRI
jgi:hypothetical protein